MTLVVVGRILSHDFGQFGARANEAHLSSQHVQQLRQFVDRRLAGKGAKPSEARVAGTWRGKNERVPIVDNEGSTFTGTGMAHRTELIHAERLAIFPNSLLDEDGVAPELEGEGDRHEHGKGNRERGQEEREGYIKGALRH